jgi:uncharacterized RDD family membrane protein YckC
VTTTTAQPSQPAGFDRRFIAYFLDGLILSLISFGVTFGIPERTFSPDQVTDGLMRSAIAAALSLGYFAYTWSSLGGSPGQRLLGVRTVNAGDGSRLTMSQGAQRWGWLYGISTALFALALVPGAEGAVWLAFAYTFYLYYTTRRDPERRGFHDRKSGTFVVRAAS